MKKNSTGRRAPPDSISQSSSPDKVGWIRKFCGKGFFREIWKSRFLILRGDQLLISQKEVRRGLHGCHGNKLQGWTHQGPQQLQIFWSDRRSPSVCGTDGTLSVPSSRVGFHSEPHRSSFTAARRSRTSVLLSVEHVESVRGSPQLKSSNLCGGGSEQLLLLMDSKICRNGGSDPVCHLCERTSGSDGSVVLVSAGSDLVYGFSHGRCFRPANASRTTVLSP
uniref:PH domain-containing protein n=1 Tax=Oryzias sinensis TaxID=183150 RepID=A0A8C7X0V5_9TELE